MTLSKDTVADFTWLWGQEFFLETAEGNYIWNDPDYGGDNTIRPYNGSLKDYLDSSGGAPYGRCKGKHYVESYCGPDVVILETK